MSKPKENNTPLQSSDSTDLYLNAKKNFKPNKFEDFGYYFYPERFGSTYKPAWYEKLVAWTGTSDAVNKITCEKNVQNALENRSSIFFL